MESGLGVHSSAESREPRAEQGFLFSTPALLLAMKLGHFDDQRKSLTGQSIKKFSFEFLNLFDKIIYFAL